uniref:DNA mismatch repair protein msh6 n=1 Tax=Schistosoma curassoni TaxID=6186 RepID=A0A183L2F3_9TREM
LSTNVNQIFKKVTCYVSDSSGVLHLNSTSNKTVKEYDCQKVGIKHSSIGDVCDVVVSQKNINESKESSSDRQMTFTSAGSHSNHSNLHSSSEYPQKARRSLLDWDSFINLPKKPRNLSLKTDDLSRTLVTKTTDSRSPIKSKQEGDSRASPCLSPIKANEFVGNVKLAPLRCSTEHDKLLTNGGYSSSEEHSKSVPARGGESSDFSSPDFTLSSIPVKNRAETRKRRSSHFATASNDSEVSSDQLDMHSQRQNQKKILIGNHNSKKRKLSPSVRIRRTKDTFTCIAKENLHNGVQSPDFDFDTGNSIHCQKVSCRSLCGACDHDNHISNELNLRELSGSIASQQNHSLANNSLTITHVATQRPSLRLKKSSKLPKVFTMFQKH